MPLVCYFTGIFIQENLLQKCAMFNNTKSFRICVFKSHWKYMQTQTHIQTVILYNYYFIEYYFNQHAKIIFLI